MREEAWGQLSMERRVEQAEAQAGVTSFSIGAVGSYQV